MVTPGTHTRPTLGSDPAEGTHSGPRCSLITALQPATAASPRQEAAVPLGLESPPPHLELKSG